MPFDCSRKKRIENASPVGRSEAFFSLTELLLIKLLLDSLAQAPSNMHKGNITSQVQTICSNAESMHWVQKCTHHCVRCYSDLELSDTVPARNSAHSNNRGKLSQVSGQLCFKVQ